MIAKLNFHSRSLCGKLDCCQTAQTPGEVQQVDYTHYVGMCTYTRHIKSCLYEFHHEYMLPLFHDKYKIMYIDTVLYTASSARMFTRP